MGSGSARVEVPVGGGVGTETASLGLWRALRNGYVQLLVAATGLSPVIARIVIPSLLYPATSSSRCHSSKACPKPPTSPSCGHT